MIKVKDFPDGRVLEDGLLLTDPQIDEEYRRSRLKEGDLLISIRGTIGRLAFVPAALAGANITQDTARLSLRADNDSEYIRAMLGSRFVQKQIAEFTTGLAVKGINIGELRRVRVPMIEKNQQMELCREVIAIQTAIEDCDRQLEKARLIDFVDVERNQYVVTTQYTLQAGAAEKRPDLVLLVNGIPLVVIDRVDDVLYRLRAIVALVVLMHLECAVKPWLLRTGVFVIHRH